MTANDQNPVVVGAHSRAPSNGAPSDDINSVGEGLKPSLAIPSDSNLTDPFSSRPKRSSLAAQGLMVAITGYQKYVSPLKGAPTCRFYPTCSSYALEAVQIHGAVKGTILATLRVLKCQPLHPGGFDPVPSLGNWKNDPRV